MARVFVNDTTLTDIADAIREKLDTEQTYKPSEMAEAVRGIQSGGSGESLTEYMVSLDGAFRNSVFAEGTEIDLRVGTKLENPNYNVNGFRQIFMQSSNLKKVKMTTKPSDISANLQNLFYACAELEVVDWTDFALKIGTFTQAFGGCNTLKEIKGVIDLSSCTVTSGTFSNCYALESVTFKEKSIYVNIDIRYAQNLSDDSIQSIIDGLADLTGSTAQTLTLHATVKAKLSEEQIATITSKNWTLA